MARQLHRELNNRHSINRNWWRDWYWIVSRFWTNDFVNWTFTVIYLHDYWDYFIRIYARIGRIVIK